ncbi:nuclear transcription factor Y subunit C-2-like [Lotus japonicus]|uniref:nuclear transcription factor Y subunit C-2-like n=1 Tax=Lotus japonicus TaxID=34305 RepID=UPI002588F509|nr:nuclear transcription factor Y subunit C-2-like [Lotus japonicus]
MDEKQPEPKQPEEGQDTPTQEANVMDQNKPNPFMTTNTQIAGGSSTSCYPRGQLYPHQQIHQLQQQHLERRIDNFWKTQSQEIENTNDFNHALPLARIKKIMKADDEVKMIAAEAPILLSKACEMFIKELTTRAWVNAEENKRRTLLKSDFASAISRTDVYDFLVDIVPRNETMEHDVYAGIGMPPMRGNVANVVQNVPPPLGPPHPYYYMPSPASQHFGAAIPPRMVMARPPFAHPIYMQQPPYPYGLQVMHPAPQNLMMKNSPDSDDQNKK